MTIMGCLVYSNECIYGQDLWTGFNGVTHANNCNIGDIYGTLTTSNNIISVDPKFANTEAGDFHLLYGSPCIDAGSTNAGGGMIDMDGEARPFGVAMDMGADEFVDMDADNMADYWEIREYGDILTTEGTEDTDGDALDTFGEYMNQTDPHDSDTDSDLALDGWEVANGYDPKDKDMDGDGMWDGWEFNYGLNAFTNDASLNPDGDAHNNGSEFLADTDPLNPDSILQMLGISEQWGGIRLDWKGGIDSWQLLESNTNLMDAESWEVIFILPPPRPRTNAVIIFEPQMDTDEHRFYRIRAERVVRNDE